MALGTFGSTLNDELNRLANGGTYRDMDQMVDEALAAKQWANRENINPYSTDTVGILNEIAGLGLDKKNWLDFNGVCNYIAGTTGLPAAAALRQVYPTTDLLTGVASYYVDATAPTNWGSLGYVYLNGVNGNYLSVPDATNLRITSDLDLRFQVAMDDWTPSAIQYFGGKYSATDRGWALQLDTAGTLTLTWSPDGTTTNLTATSTVTTGITDGSTKWIRATLDVDNGASGRDIKFFTSDNGTSWTQLGTTITQAGTTSIFASTQAITIGTYAFVAPTNVLAGKVYRAQVLNGIGGTTVLDVNIATDYRSSNQSFFTSTTGQTVTVNGVDTIANLGAAGSLLPTTLGSSTAADSNDPKFLDHTGTNYVYTPGVVGNFLSVPDAAALDITGDIDIRWYGSLDDWTPAASNAVIAKWTGGTSSWYFRVVNGFGPFLAGALQLVWIDSGGTERAAGTNLNIVPFSDGALGWIRVTLDVDNGAGGNDAKFFTSTDGTNWTQLGSTVTQAFTTSIRAGTALVGIGQRDGDMSVAGKHYRAQILDGIDGTTVLDVDTSVITAGSATSFTAVTGQTVTINRSTSGRKTVAVTQPTWLFGTDDYMEVNNRYMSSGTYLYLPGVSGNFASTPDSAALDITGDIDIRVKVALDDWTPSTQNALLAKSAAGNDAYELNVTTAGLLRFGWVNSSGVGVGINSTIATGVTDGSTKWVRATLDVDNGAGGYDLKFWLSDDGSTWTQLGTTIVGASTTSIIATSAQLNIGTYRSGINESRGKFFRAQVRNGIDGTVAFDANFETSITSLLQTSFTESSANAATVTINRSGSAYRSAGITTAGYLYPGATNTFTASATDFLNFGAADSFTALVVARNWATTNDAMFMAKSINGISATMVGYVLYNNTTGSTGQLSARIGDGTNRIVPTAIDNVSGANKVVLLIRNVASDTVNAYINTTATSASDTTTGSLSNIATLQIGTSLGGSFQPMEFYAAAVFRQALSLAQIRQVSNYFANREVYL